jgi:hypothetical protein
MALSRKSYVLIAEAVSEANRRANKFVSPDDQNGVEVAIRLVVEELCRNLKSDNYAFDADRFRAACK